MQKNNIIYWTTTALLALVMVYSAVLYLTSPDLVQAFHHLGFPDFFRVELAAAKIIGSLLLLLPVPPRWKEWAYAGFGITFISGMIAHTLVDGVATAVAPAVFLGILVVSYLYWNKRLHVKAGA